MVRDYRESNVAALSARAANTGGTMQGEAEAEAALRARDIATFMKTIDDMAEHHGEWSHTFA